ncbi:hypothetical protein IWW36_005703 [Coemansia brasiliensis]|uniref:Uncharacterized protein n=1 Tax=Coemansia brasiliensis TaxID=2650707 RepID=A0A9W8LXK4_9FUNG|nr:hypothetical protein IWW36_005703 [Coemansia brasiliensis]
MTNNKLPLSTQLRLQPVVPNALPRMKAPSQLHHAPHYAPYRLDTHSYAVSKPAPLSSSSSSASPPVGPMQTSELGPATQPQHYQQQQQQPASTRKRSRHAWPAEMTRQIINVLLDEFLNDPAFRTTIYRSREERDSRFISSGRSILEEYNKVQNIRRRYFIPLSYLLQWDQLRLSTGSLRSRQRGNIEKKLAKPLERSRLQMIFCSALKQSDLDKPQDVSDDESERDTNGKPVFELDIFVTELKRRDMRLWAKGVAAFHAWVSRKCSIDFIINHA